MVDAADLGKQFKGNFVDGSSGRFDSRVTTWGSPSYLQNEATLYPCMRVIPTSTGLGFTKDRARRRNADNSDWIEEDLTKHYHDNDSDETGGSFTEIERRNLGAVLRWLGNTYNATNFYTDASGTGAAVSNEVSGDVGRIKIEAGTTLNGYANAAMFGVPLSFSNNSAYEIMLEHEGNLTSYLMKAGWNAEHINVVNSSAQQLICIEACSASGSNVLLASCKPPSRSTLITGYVHDTNIHSWYIQHIIADNKIYLTRDVDFPNTVFKTDDVPVSGHSVSAKFFNMGMKTTVGSASKILRYYGSSGSGTYGDAAWKFDYGDIGF